MNKTKKHQNDNKTQQLKTIQNDYNHIENNNRTMTTKNKIIKHNQIT